MRWRPHVPPACCRPCLVCRPAKRPCSVASQLRCCAPCCCRYEGIEGDYSELLASSIFCLVVPGDGWTARMDDATLHGCIPVIIMVGGGVGCSGWL